jgi:hypothetical protein
MSRQLGVQVPIRVEIAQGRTTALAMAESEGANLVVVGNNATFSLNESPFWFHLLTGSQVNVEVMVIPNATTTSLGGWLWLRALWWSRYIRNGILASLT